MIISYNILEVMKKSLLQSLKNNPLYTIYLSMQNIENIGKNHLYLLTFKLLRSYMFMLMNVLFWKLRGPWATLLKRETKQTKL